MERIKLLADSFVCFLSTGFRSLFKKSKNTALCLIFELSFILTWACLFSLSFFSNIDFLIDFLFYVGTPLNLVIFCFVFFRTFQFWFNNSRERERERDKLLERGLGLVWLSFSIWIFDIFLVVFVVLYFIFESIMTEVGMATGPLLILFFCAVRIIFWVKWREMEIRKSFKK